MLYSYRFLLIVDLSKLTPLSADDDPLLSCRIIALIYTNFLVLYGHFQTFVAYSVIKRLSLTSRGNTPVLKNVFKTNSIQ